MDSWFEEDVEVYTHPRDPYTRVDALPSSRHVVVEVDGVKVADSTHPTLLFETGLPVRYYLPKTDVRFDLLTPTDHHTRCPYKGTASYWTPAQRRRAPQPGLGLPPTRSRRAWVWPGWCAFTTRRSTW